MTTSTITNTVTDPSGAAIVGARVVARLVPAPCFRITEGTEIEPVKETVTDATGAWSLVLERTANITPANSNYEIVEYLPDAPKKHTIQVVGNASLAASLVSPPPAASGNTYLTQAAGDARYALLGGSTFGSPVAVQPGLASTDGVSTSVARSDHRHAVNTVWANTAARPGTPSEGLFGYQQDTDDFLLWDGAAWVRSGNVRIVTSGTRPPNPFNGQQIYETDTLRVLVYNGTAWVVITPQSATVATLQTTVSVAYADLATVGPAVTLQTGAKALITLSCQGWQSAAGNVNNVAVAVSGATTLAAADANSVVMTGAVALYQQTPCRTFLLSGLTPGVNTFTAKYKVNAGTGSFTNRDITVVGIP
jgi:hypothetical protein